MSSNNELLLSENTYISTTGKKILAPLPPVVLYCVDYQ
jgi:hypothetical protein